MYLIGGKASLVFRTLSLTERHLSLKLKLNEYYCGNEVHEGTCHGEVRKTRAVVRQARRSASVVSPPAGVNGGAWRVSRYF
ncbi:hypothetical protein E2C01_092534 [Portunus trituberculatus]|uniref:Uncharacterized protein n=1 Tax=Portunus trituberculatus TaxID=210409 RepID=A0A5B7JKH9_PORTR|nr:hypothetical protein [Portunus trituberculatus]